MTVGGTIALTGATGFLGSHIADALLAAGYGVRAGVRPTSNRRWLEGKSLKAVTIDLRDDAACDRFLAGTAGLVHCAGVVVADDEAAYRAGNLHPTETLLRAAERTWGDDPAATVVFVSSLAAHGPATLSAPAREDQPPHPISAYGRSKRAAEQAVERAPGGFRRTILRPPSLYGPRDREFLPLYRAALHGWTLRLGGNLDGVSLVDGRDAAAAAVALLTTPNARGTYFVSDRNVGYDWDAIRSALARAAGRRLRRLDVPLGMVKAAAAVAGLWRGVLGNAVRSGGGPMLNADRMRDLSAPGWVCDGSRLTRDTGFVPARDAANGFAEAMAHARQIGWL